MEMNNTSLTFQAASVCPAQFVFLNVPTVSRFAWHPLSIAATYSDNPLTTTAIVHVKRYGQWSKVLFFASSSPKLLSSESIDPTCIEEYVLLAGHMLEGEYLQFHLYKASW